MPRQPPGCNSPHPESMRYPRCDRDRDVKRSNCPYIPYTTLYTHDSVLSSIGTESNNLRYIWSISACPFDGRVNSERWRSTHLSEKQQDRGLLTLPGTPSQ